MSETGGFVDPDPRVYIDESPYTKGEYIVSEKYGKPLTAAQAEELFRMGDHKALQFCLKDGTVVYVARVFRELWMALDYIGKLERINAALEDAYQRTMEDGER